MIVGLKKNFMIVGDGGIFGVGFKEILAPSAFNIHSVNDLSEASCLMEHKERDQGISLLIFFADIGDKNWQLCKELLDKYPRLPAIAVLPNDHPVEKEFEHSAIRVVSRPLTSKEKFKELIENLSQVGEWELSWVSMPDSGEGTAPIQSLIGFFDTMEFDVVIDQVLNHFLERVPCEDIVWIREEEYSKMVTAVSDERIVNYEYQSYDRDSQVKSLKGMTENVILNHVRALPKFSQIKGPLKGGSEEGDVSLRKEDVLVPVLHEDRKEVYGYLLFIGMELDDHKEILGSVGETLRFLVRHIGFSLDMWNFRKTTYEDDLTGLFNQKYMHMVLDAEIERSEKEQLEFALLFLDVDYFKQVNDNLGHWVGSKLLIELGKIFKDEIRFSDYAFRYGGDEFVLLLVNSTKENAKIVAERIRSRVENENFCIDGFELELTVSIGLSTYPVDAKSSEQILKLADQAMYYGKHKSRNIVYLAS